MEKLSKGDKVWMTIVLTLIIGLMLVIAWGGIKLAARTFMYAEAKRATAECQEWQDQARVFKNYYLTDWQKEQCDYYNIKIEIK